MNNFNRLWKSLLIFLTFSENIQGTPLRKYKEGALRIFLWKLQTFWKIGKGTPVKFLEQILEVSFDLFFTLEGRDNFLTQQETQWSLI